jgi:hypothetical protein
LTTYSFKDTSGAFAHPSVGAFTLNGGNIGLGRITVSMTTEKSVQDVASDGSVMTSFISGDNGTAQIEVQQTSDLHAFLLSWYNQIKTLADAGDVTLWAAGTLTLRNLVDGTSHYLSGISPTKLPDKVYEAHGQKLVWTLMAADAQQIAT